MVENNIDNSISVQDRTSNINDRDRKRAKNHKKMKRYIKKRNKQPLPKHIQAKILMKFKSGTKLPYIRKEFHLKKDNKYFNKLIDDYNNKRIDVSNAGDLIPSINKEITEVNDNPINNTADNKETTGKSYSETNNTDYILNKCPNIFIVHGILVRSNLSKPQINPIMLKYMHDSYACDKNPKILYPTMIAMGVSQQKASLIINEIKAALFGTADDYLSYTNNTNNPNVNSNTNLNAPPQNKTQFMINYDKTANGYAPNNQPPVPIDPDEADMKCKIKLQRRRMYDGIAQAMETAIKINDNLYASGRMYDRIAQAMVTGTIMKVINSANMPTATAPAMPGSIIRQIPVMKDGNVVRDEFGNIIYITETVPAGTIRASAQNTPETNSKIKEIKEIKEAIQSLSNKVENMNKNNTTSKYDTLTSNLVSYFKDVANKSIEEKKSMEDKYYNLLFTLLSENKKEVESKLKSLEQNSDPMYVIKYFNEIKKVISNGTGYASNVGIQLEIEKLRAESARDIEKNKLDFERWKEEQRLRTQEKAEDMRLQQELKEMELQFSKQTDEKNSSKMHEYMNFGEKIVNQITPIAKEAMQGFLDAKSGGARVAKTDKEPNSNSNSNNNSNTLNIAELSDKELEQVINKARYFIQKYNNEIIPAVRKELERRKTQKPIQYHIYFN